MTRNPATTINMASTATQDPYLDLVRATARTIQEWAFWRWLGRRTHFIPWEAYQGLLVRADGEIMDVGACTVAAAYQRLRTANPDRQWPNVGETGKGWSAFLGYVQGASEGRNVLKGGQTNGTDV